MSRNSLQALLLAHLHHDGAEPVEIGGLDREPSLPARIEQVLVAARRLLALHQVGVERGREDVEPRRHPFAVRAERERREILGGRRLDRDQELLAMQRLELRGDRGEGVDRAAAGAVLVDRALHELLGARAPVLEVDAVLLAEGVAHRPHVLGDGGTVDRHHFLLLGAGDQPLRAVGPLIGGDLGDASAPARTREPRRAPARQRGSARQIARNSRPSPRSPCRRIGQRERRGGVGRARQISL